MNNILSWFYGSRYIKKCFHSVQGNINEGWERVLANSFSGIYKSKIICSAVVFLTIEKTGSQLFFLSLTPLKGPYTVKMTWSSPKMPCTQGFLYGCDNPSECGDEDLHRRHSSGCRGTFYKQLSARASV